jgi:hypothetical protein
LIREDRAAVGEQGAFERRLIWRLETVCRSSALDLHLDLLDDVERELAPAFRRPVHARE